MSTSWEGTASRDIVTKKMHAGTIFPCRSISEQAAFHFTSNLTLRCVMYILHVLNYSINILLYCVANKTIRKEAYRRLSSIFNCKNLYWREWYETTIRRSGKS